MPKINQQLVEDFKNQLDIMSKINWTTVKEYTDITYKKANHVARIAFNRPEVRNAFRPKTTAELFDALCACPGKMMI